MSIIIFIFILGILIFVHELGHFVTAKWFGIRVDEFGMGFPPRALKLFKKGETEYTLNWIPFGGFVKIYGEDSLSENDPDYARSLVAKKWWKQIIVLIAGVTMNVILAWFLFSVSFMMGAPTPESQVQHPERLKNTELTILAVQENSPAAVAGLKSGDKIIRASTQSGIISNASAEGFTAFIQSSDNVPVQLEIIRGKETMEINVSPEENKIGVAIDRVGTYRLGFFPALWQGAQTTYYSTIQTVVAFGKLVSGKVGINAVTGPVGLVGVVGDAQKIGFSYLLILTAIISINLAVINMVPFPALDGGRILFIIVEKIIRRKLPVRAVQWANGIGFVLLIILMVVITIKDIVGLF